MLSIALVATFLIRPTNAVAASNTESEQFLWQNARKEGVTELPSTLQYKIIRTGLGKHHPEHDSPVACHYKGTLIDGVTEFDSSYKRGTPSVFQPRQVIKGWTEAMQLMVEGDKWELYIPADLAYGDSGSPPLIKKGDALIFTMEMIEIKGTKVDDKFQVRCDVGTGKNCIEKEFLYIEKAKNKFLAVAHEDFVPVIDKEIERIGRVSENGTDNNVDWANRRIRILNQFKLSSSTIEPEKDL